MAAREMERTWKWSKAIFLALIYCVCEDPDGGDTLRVVASIIQ